MNLIKLLKGTGGILFLVLLGSCSSSDPEPVDCSMGPSVTVENVQDANCAQDNGSITVTVNGGNGGLEFSIAGSNFQSIQAGTSTISDVPDGSLTISIRDADGCTASANFIISNINNVALGTDLSVSGCKTANGSITVEATGGVEPYTYSINGSASTSSNTFTSLEAGDYTVLVTDDEGCESSSTVTLLSGVSYQNDIIPLINANCAITGCHDGNDGSIPDWTSLSNVQNSAANIKTRTGDGTMPPDGQEDLEQSEIDIIACWVDDGALDN